MNEDIVNQAILESAPVAEQQPITTPEITEEVAEESASTEAKEPDDVPFPKKAVKALSRRDVKIGKLQANNAALEQRLAQYEQQQAKSPSGSAPKEEAFDNYGEYLKAVTRHELKQELSQSQKQQEEQHYASQQEAYYAERTDYAIDKAKLAIETIPDYKQLFMENADILQSLPPHIERAFYEAEEPALAFYALAKEGRLDAILEMSPARAAIEIGKAEVRGEALSKARQITKAPAPIEGLKGTGTSSKTISEHSTPQELLKWLNTK